ncbi:low temperature requirement protein A [Gordonia sp. L191]|uniref:low temperature requirement protein A n=1 Tax=Gordonia sp. L191 TaxID=2982699 RepID=UPI0024BFAD18|nr:low temperature requirement protein A [Gordonia sp. L191]WHU47758.1 low temperature requirement protein A [Gordonia sp. L191]
MTSRIGHRLAQMTGRDPHQPGRAATSLELFFDLVFVVVFSVAGTQMAHYLAEGHYRTAVFGYVLCTFAAIWAWINFSWFASAFDTDDWFFRGVVLIQMIGVAIVALGVAPVFGSIEHHEHVDIRVLVIGYVVMRVGLLTQWIRAGLQSAEYRRTCFTYAAAVLVAQVAWVIVAIVDLALWPTIIAIALCAFIELLGPIVAENFVKPTPWHPHHIAERYSLLTIITLGEGVVGTVAVMQAAVEAQGWSVQTAVFGVAAIVVTFAMWWIYFVIPVGDRLHARPDKCFPWGYGHIVIFMAAAATGAGLEVAALWTEHEATISPGVVVATVAVPLGIYCLAMLTMYDYLLPFDPVTLLCGAGTVAFLVGGVWAAGTGLSLSAAVVLVACAPLFIVVVDEIFGTTRRANTLGVPEAAPTRNPDCPIDLTDR